MRLIKIFKAIEENKLGVLNDKAIYSCINKKNKKGLTPIHYAVICKNTQAVRFLLEYGADIDIYNKYGFTPLQTASSMDYYEIVEVLMKHKLYKTWYEPMMLAASKNNYQTFYRLIKLGGDVNGYVKDKEGPSLLHWAAQEGNIDIIRLLVENGAAPDLLNESCLTPLYMSASEGYLDIVNYLISCGANLEGRIEQGFNKTTPLMIATSWNRINVVDALLKQGANIEARDRDGRTSLFYAVLRQHNEVVDLLIRNGARQDIKDYRGYILKDLSNPSVRKKIEDEEDFFDTIEHKEE